MKFISLVVAIIFIQCCAAQTNKRSSVWLLANTQILTANSQNPQNCIIPVTTGGVASPAITLLRTSNLIITGTFIQLGQGVPGTDGFVTDTTAGSNSILYSVTIEFIYNSTYSIRLSIPPQQSYISSPTPLTVDTLFRPSYLPYWTSIVGGSASTLYPIVFGTNTIISPTGSTWLSFQNIPTLYSPTALPGSIAATSGIIITDYVSSSTIALTLWNDNSGPDSITSGRFNGFYQVGVRTQTNKIWSTSSVLANGANCASSGGRRKRIIDHLIKKRTALSTCALTSIDPSMSSSVLTTVCLRLDEIHDAAAAITGTQTRSDLVDAFNKGVMAMNALYQVDSAAFSTTATVISGSKFILTGSFSMTIDLSKQNITKLSDPQISIKVSN